MAILYSDVPSMSLSQEVFQYIPFNLSTLLYSLISATFPLAAQFR